MNSLLKFIEQLASDIGISAQQCRQNLSDLEIARRVLRDINEYFYQTHSSIGKTTYDEEEFQYFSDFHKFWEAHHGQVLNPRIDRTQATKAARSFSRAVRQYGSGILGVTHKTHGLSKAAVAQVRFFTANQDFREPPKDPYGSYLKDSTRFDACVINAEPDTFLRFIGATRLSQSDKRLDFAQNAAKFLLNNNITAFQIAATFGYDATAIRDAMMNTPNMGYGAKKTNMFIRDMVELKVWPKLNHYDQIDVRE